ncbi:MAG: YndJ family protein [Chloroflexota bacterium]
MQLEQIRRWWLWVLALGSVTWCVALGLYLVNESTLLNTIELLLLFGVGVTTPLAMRVAMQANRHNTLPRIATLAIIFYPFSIIAVASSLFTSAVWISIGLAIVWQIQTILLSLYGLYRLLQRPVIAIEELCIDFGLLYMPISGVWFLAYSANFPLLTFDSVSVILTAIHFTFISPGALVIIGMIGRRQHTRAIYRLGASLAIISPLLVAMGITLTQFSARMWLEAGSVIVLATSFLLLSVICLFGGLPRNLLSRMLIGLSAIALFVTMTFAIAYSSGRFSGQWAIALNVMVQWHGWLNAVGFTFLALLAWNIAIPDSKVSPSGIPFSRLPWRYRIGASYFESVGAIDTTRTPAPTGILADLADYQQVSFNVDDVHPDVRAFYEHTASHTLLVYPDWQRGFHHLGRLYKRVSE